MRDYTIHLEAVVQRARRLVINKGLTYAEAAEYLDIPRATIQHWVEGTSRKSVPNPDGTPYDPKVADGRVKYGPYEAAKRVVNRYFIEAFYSHSDGDVETFSKHEEWRVVGDSEEHGIWQPYIDNLRHQGWVVRWFSSLAVFLAIHPEKPQTIGVIRATALSEDRADEDLRVLPEGIYSEV